MLTSTDPDTVWWEFVSGSSRLVTEIANILRTGKSVLLHTTSVLPFRDAFFHNVADLLREADEKLLLDGAECAGDPAAYLIGRFGLSSYYRETMKPADFLRGRCALHHRLITVPVNAENVRGWLDFLYMYKSASINEGLFLLETKQPELPSMNKYSNAIRVLEYTDFISEYDILNFAGLMSGSVGATFGQRRYAAAIAASLHGNDVESIPVFLNQYTVADDVSILLPSATLTGKEVEQRLWNAQAQEIFPLIMRETREFIECWRLQLDEALRYVKTASNYIDSEFSKCFENSYHEEISSPDDMEIGNIYFLMNRHQQNPNGSQRDERVLYIPDEAVRERITLLRRVRNCIAHGKVGSVEDIAQLLNI